jgi:hypothetical protein
VATIPHYHNGTWTEADHDGEVPAGWPVAVRAGDENGLHVIAYAAGGGRFLVRICQEAGQEHDELLWAGSLHDVLDLAGRWAPLMTAGLIDSEVTPYLSQIARDVHAQ